MSFRSRALRLGLGLFLLLAVAAVMLTAHLGDEGLTDPDESAYAESVREMVERGDWLVPHLYGEPLLDKPIFFYWAMGASFRLFGENELAARLPSVLAALVLLLAVLRLGFLIYGSETAGWIAAFILLASPQFVVMGRAAVTDMILTAFCTLGILCYLETLGEPRHRILPLAGAACFGLAALTKGPVGLLLPLLVLGGYLAITRSLPRLRLLRPVASLIVIAALAVPWYAAIAVARPDLVERFFVTGNLGRFLRPEHQAEPPLYYLVVLSIGFLPWSAFLPGAVGRSFLDWRRGSILRPRLLPAVWLLALLAFFTLAASKLPSYILPALPAAALLAAGSLEEWLDPEPGKTRPAGVGAMIFLTIFTAGIACFVWKANSFGSVPMDLKAALLPLTLSGVAGSLVALGALLAGRSRTSYFLLLAGSMILIFSLVAFGFPRLEAWKSSREPADVVRSLLQPSDAVILYRENHPGFAYYLRRVPELIRAEPELVARLEAPRRLYCLMGWDRYERLKIRHPAAPLHLLKKSGHVAVVTNFLPGVEP
ncbi:MAG TPA: glycosyltransferase family 39 protein [Candidatus Polarisedimenticolia bacterium]|jgi:4-amino-4-deoxy-L-arabinose transferase-like glycosyltransferase|nr:glycosyltransferase family 39 protein [Candidatus Polarisedimenticolia bacterium]